MTAASREIPITKTADPWPDFWYVRLYDDRACRIGQWRVPLSPPYSLRYVVDVDSVAFWRVEFLDHDLVVRAVWDCDTSEIFYRGDTFQLNIHDYG